jgi:lipopolysaccharide biosynthesis regulator YciM
MKPSRPLPPKLKNYLYKVAGIAIANKRYRWAINIIEKYANHYLLPENEKYRLALLYDHLAMKMKQKLKNKQKIKLLNKYLKKATALYKEILKINPNYLHANYGLGRVYGIKGNYSKAIKCQIKAYKQMLKLPRNRRGALAIGSLYEGKKDLKNAEKWYLKEYKECAPNDFGTALNLFSFYCKTSRNYKKTLIYAKKVKKLLKKEYKKSIYRGLNMKQSKFIQSIKRGVRDIKPEQ